MIHVIPNKLILIIKYESTVHKLTIANKIKIKILSIHSITITLRRRSVFDIFFSIAGFVLK